MASSTATRSRLRTIAATVIAALSLSLLLAAPPPGARAADLPPETYYQGVTPTMTTPNGLPPGDDSLSAALPIGFNFTYYGASVDTFYMYTNGFMTLGAGNNPTGLGSTFFNNVAIPNNNSPNTIIAAFWDDLDSTSTGGYLLYQTIGSAPNRKLIAQWTNTGFYNQTTPLGTFQIVLYEGTNEIQIQYRVLVSQSARAHGSEATVGIENGAGTAGIQFSRNQNVLTSGQAIRFTPSGATYTVNSSAPYDGVLLGKAAVVAPNMPVQICPANTGVVSTTPTFSWADAGAGVTYRLVVANNSDFTSPAINATGLTSTSYTPGTALAVGTTYYWSVIASNATDSTWSEQWRFTTAASGFTPCVPQLIAPEQQETGVALSPTFLWEAVPGVSSYRLVVSPNADLSSPVLNQSGISGTSQSVTGLAYGTTYYWQVTAVNGASSAPSTIRRFTTVGQPLSLAVSPASVAENGGSSLTYTFSRTGGTATPLTVLFDVGGTATFSSDYTQSGAASFSATAGSVTIGAGQTSADVVISPVADPTWEANETVALTLIADLAYTINTAGAVTATIANDDQPPVSITATDADASEAGPTSGTFRISRSVAGPELLVSLSASGSAGASDYSLSGAGLSGASPSFTVSLPSGELFVDLTLTPSADNLVESAETATLTLQPDPAYTLGATTSADVTIADDPPLVTISAPASVSEGQSVTFSVSRTGGDTSSPLSVPLSLSYGGGASSADIGSVPASVSVQASSTFVVATIGDAPPPEAGESITISLGASGDTPPTYSLGAANSATVVLDDVAPPAVASITRLDPSPTNASSLRFSVTFSEAVSGVDASDFQLSAGGLTATSISGVTGSGSDYTVTVDAGSAAESGILSISLQDDDSITSVASGIALGGVGSGNGDTTGPSYTVDRTPLTVTVAKDAAQPDPTATAPILFTVTFSKPVADFDEDDVLLAGTASPTDALVSGSGTSYTVTVSGMTSAGTVIISIPSGLAHDAAGNGNQPGDAASVQFSPTAPVVTGIVPLDPTPTNATSVRFGVTFSQAVTGVNTADFQLDTALAGAAVTGVTGSGQSYTVTVNAGSAAEAGALGLNLLDNDSIADATYGVALGGAGAGNGDYTGATYAVDRTPLTVTIARAGTQANPTTTLPIQFTVTFNKPVTGFTGADVALSGSARATSATVSGGPAVYTVSVGATADVGFVTVGIPAGAAQDAAGNMSQATLASATVKLEDGDAPTATLASAPDLPAGGSAPATIVVEYRDSVGMNLVTLGDDDLIVAGPSGPLSVHLVSVGPAAGAGAAIARRVTYAVDAPGGYWSYATIGSYTVTIAAFTAEDTSGHPVASGTLGSFRVTEHRIMAPVVVVGR